MLAFQNYWRGHYILCANLFRAEALTRASDYLGVQCKYRKVPRQTNFQKEWRGSNPIVLDPPSRSRTNPRRFEEKL
ncbi:MAG: hypothetical protein A3C13_02435 [Candidatus Lloydbacteria bacterium RIFCSPHIGHO2_02_FULL_50_11]|nr:MAG: hypothetical protein A3C13_02435 [Candidatus Lloydbacteria bacterium RIFCSPHIGHO2_02_FULL_50_11]